MSEIWVPGHSTGITKEEMLVLEEYERRRTMRGKGRDLLSYMQVIYPWMLIEEIHVLIRDALKLALAGEVDRIMLQMMPRIGKSLTTSEAIPAFWMGNMPSDQILHSSYAAPLVEGFGRKIRNTIASDIYGEIFPKCRLARDQRASTPWATTAGGVYNAVGIGGGIAGKGFNLGIIDDPISEQDMFSKPAMDFAYEWYGSGFYTRRMPARNVIILTMTRWNTIDLAGRLLSDQATNLDADKWLQIKIPAILDDEAAALLNSVANDPVLLTAAHPEPRRFRAGESCAPRRWPLKEIQRTRNTLTKFAFSALYMQSPIVEGGGILNKDDWRKWPSSRPPRCVYVLHSYDTAFEEDERNDYTVRTRWGIFIREEDGMACAILLGRWKERVSFPVLREDAIRTYREDKPDRVIVEKKASGHSLLQELRRAGVPIKAMPASKSKMTRAHAASLPLEQGCVYYMPGRWADEVIDLCAAFPNGAEDDTVDSVTHALVFFRRMFHLDIPTDPDDDDDKDELLEKIAVGSRKSYAVRHGTYRRMG